MIHPQATGRWCPNATTSSKCVSSSSWSASPSLHRGNTATHYHLLSNSKNIHTFTQNTLQIPRLLANNDRKWCHDDRNKKTKTKTKQTKKKRQRGGWWWCSAAFFSTRLCPTSSHVSHGSKSCEKTLIIVPKAAGNAAASPQSCGCHTCNHTHRLKGWTTNIHPQAQRTYKDISTHFFLCSYFSQHISLLSLFFMFFVRFKTLCRCWRTVLITWLQLADFQKTASPHRPGADIKCLQVWSLVSDQFSY